MRLKWARVRNFKSIDDSGVVEFEQGVTCLVGKNESGKTAFLEALHRLRPITLNAEANFDGLRDYPRRKWTRDRQHVPEIQPIEAAFELATPDIRVLTDKFGAVLQHPKIVLSKNYANSASWVLELDEAAAVRHFVTAQSLDPALAESCATFAVLHKKIEDSPELAPTVAASVAERLKAYNLKTQVTKELGALAPKFLYFDEYSQLPGRFSVPYVQSTPEAQLDPRHRTALSFLRLAGVGTADFPHDQYEARKAALEAAAATITSEVFEFWTQNKELVVQVDLDFAPPKAPAPSPQPPTPDTPPFLDIRIFNPKHAVSINFSQRSSGFVWFFSFLVAFSEFGNMD